MQSKRDPSGIKIQTLADAERGIALHHVIDSLALKQRVKKYTKVLTYSSGVVFYLFKKSYLAKFTKNTFYRKKTSKNFKKNTIFSFLYLKRMFG